MDFLLETTARRYELPDLVLAAQLATERLLAKDSDLPLRIASRQGETLWSMADEDGRPATGAVRRLLELAGEVPLLLTESYIRMQDWTDEQLEEEVRALLEVDATEGDRHATLLKARILREEARTRMDDYGERLIRRGTPFRSTHAQSRDRLAWMFHRLGLVIGELQRPV